MSPKKVKFNSINFRGPAYNPKEGIIEDSIEEDEPLNEKKDTSSQKDSESKQDDATIEEEGEENNNQDENSADDRSIGTHSTKSESFEESIKSEHSADHSEHSADHSEHSADHSEHSADHSEHSADHSEHSADHSEHSADHSEHSADHSKHSADHSEHSAAKSEHSAAKSKHSAAKSKHEPEETPARPPKLPANNPATDYMQDMFEEMGLVPEPLPPQNINVKSSNKSVDGSRSGRSTTSISEVSMDSDLRSNHDPSLADDTMEKHVEYIVKAAITTCRKNWCGAESVNVKRKKK